MKNIYKYVLAGGIFFLFVGVGFMLTKIFTTDSVEKSIIKESKFSELKNTPVLNSKVNDDTIAKSSNNENLTPMEPISIVADVKNNGSDYSLQITCENAPANMMLRYEIPALRMKNSDGYFVGIPGCKSASYKVNVVDVSTGKILVSRLVHGFVIVKSEPVELMTKSEFQSLLLNHGDNSLLGGKNPKVSRNIYLTFEGLRDGDIKPEDILAVREKISYGIWGSAMVIRVGYDNTGKINSAKIKPIYND